MSCDPSTQLTPADVSNAKSNIDTLKEVIESNADTVVTPDGKTIDTVSGALKKIGFEVPPQIYAAGITLNVGDERKLIERDGILYAPLPSELPFTTTSWGGIDENKFYPVTGAQGETSDYVFSTSADMAAGTTIGGVVIVPELGYRLSTMGFISVDDGGQADYVVTNNAPDGVDNIDLGSGLTATLTQPRLAVKAPVEGRHAANKDFVENLLVQDTVSGTLVAGDTIIDISPLAASGDMSLIINTVENPFTVLSETTIQIPAPYSANEPYTVKANKNVTQVISGSFNTAITYPSLILDNTSGRALIEPINLFSNTRGYSTDFDPRSLKPVRANTYHVNPWEGSDANDGLTLGTAFKTLSHALGLPGDNEIILEPGDYPYVYGTNEIDPNKGVTIRCDVGVAKLTNKALPHYWREHPGFPGVYETDNALPDEDFGVVKADLRFFANPSRGTANIGGTKLDLLASAAAVTGGGVGWYVGGSITLLRMPNDVAPTTENLEIWYAKQNLRVTCNDLLPHTIYIENIECWRGLTNSCLIEMSHEDSIFVGLNCKFMRSLTNDGFEANFYGRCYVWGCVAGESFRDGFNYHTNVTPGATGASSVYEVECESFFNGRQGAANNGSTLHNSLRGVRLNCVHNNSDNRNIQDINSSMSFNVGVIARHSGQQGFDDIVCGRDATPDVDPTIMWLIGCEAGRVKVEDDALLHLSADNQLGQITTNGSLKVFNPNP